MRKQFLKLISCLLVVSIVLSITTTTMMPILTVSAAESATTDDDRATEEAKADAQSPYVLGWNAGDWDKARSDGKS